MSKSFELGDRVYHEDFGKGTVVRCIENYQTVSVWFDDIENRNVRKEMVMLLSEWETARMFKPIKKTLGIALSMDWMDVNCQKIECYKCPLVVDGGHADKSCLLTLISDALVKMEAV